jgi:predicted  nucleic acid-binding Zn-ribbon protein
MIKTVKIDEVKTQKIELTHKCEKCGEVKTTDQFYSKNICIDCRRKYQREYKAKWRLTHPEKPRTAEYYQKYREETKIKRGHTYPSDAYAEKRRHYQKEYYQRNKNNTEFIQKNREKSRNYNAKQKALKMQQPT